MILYDLVDGFSCSHGLTCYQVICNWMGKTGLTSNFRGSEIQYYYHYVGHDGAFCGLKCFIQQTITQCKQLINKQALDKLGLPFHAFNNFWKKLTWQDFEISCQFHWKVYFHWGKIKPVSLEYILVVVSIALLLFFSVFIFSVPSKVVIIVCTTVHVFEPKYVLVPTQSHFNPGLKAQVKITLSQAQNIFMP